LEYISRGKVGEAFTSMASDLGKHPETKGHPAILLGMDLLMNGHLDSGSKMAEFINGFN
jgi:hypothetical protein